MVVDIFKENYILMAVDIFNEKTFSIQRRLILNRDIQKTANRATNANVNDRAGSVQRFILSKQAYFNCVVTMKN